MTNDLENKPQKGFRIIVDSKGVVLYIILGFVGILALAAFSMIGYTLKEYFIYKADALQAQRGVEMLRKEADKQQQSLTKLSDEIAKKEAAIILTQQMVEEYNSLTGKVFNASSEVADANQKFVELKSKVAEYQGRLSVLKEELPNLENQRDKLKREIEDKEKEAEIVDLRNLKLKEDVSEISLERAKVIAETESAKKIHQAAAERLTNIVIYVDTANKLKRDSEVELNNAKNELSTVTSKMKEAEADEIILKAEAAKLRSSISDLKKSQEELKVAVDLANMNTENVKAEYAVALGTFSNIVSKIKNSETKLNQLAHSIEEKLEERNSLVAQIKLSEERQRKYGEDKIAIELEITKLEKQKTALVRDLIITQEDYEDKKISKTKLEAELANLQKRKRSLTDAIENEGDK